MIEGGNFRTADFQLSDGAQIILKGGNFDRVYKNDCYGTLENVLPKDYCSKTKDRAKKS